MWWIQCRIGPPSFRSPTRVSLLYVRHISLLLPPTIKTPSYATFIWATHTHTHTHTKLTCTGKWPPVTCSISVTNLCASTASFDLLSLSRVLLNIQISGGKMADFVVLAALPLQLFNLCRVSGNGIIQ